MSLAEAGERTWIDERADRFERDWKRGGERPRIEDVLADEPGPRRASLLKELIRVERELRQGAGESPNAEEYLRRFPDDRAAVEAAFGIEDRGDSPPPEPPVTAAHSLLFGLLALQNNFIDRETLLAAFNAWVADKSHSLGRILLDRGALSPARHALLTELVQRAPRPARPRPRAQPRRARRRPRRPRRPRGPARPRPPGQPPLPRTRLHRGRRRRRRGDRELGGRKRGDRRRRPVPHRPLPRPRGPRRGLRRPRPATAPHRRPEAHQERTRHRPGEVRPLRRRGRDHRPARAPRHRPGLRPGHLRRRPPVLRHAVHPRRQPQGGHRAVPPRGGGPRPRRADPGPPEAAAAVPRRLQRDRLRPQPRRAPSRLEAGQHHAGQVRRDAGGRLGPGQDRGPARGRDRRRRWTIGRWSRNRAATCGAPSWGPGWGRRPT